MSFKKQGRSPVIGEPFSAQEPKKPEPKQAEKPTKPVQPKPKNNGGK
jgi:hypothetical protein